MKRLFRTICALMLALCLPAGGLCAGVQGLDAAFGGYLDGNDDVHYAMTMQAEALMPFGEGTVDMLNAVLKHMHVGAFITDDETTVKIFSDGDPVMTLSERTADSGTELATDLLPGRVLLSAGSAMDALSGMQAEESGFDLFAAINELEGCYQKLTDAILPYAEEKKANYNIKGVGSSRWSRIARLTAEQGAELAPLIIEVLGCGMDEAFREQLAQAVFGKGFIVGLYQTKQDGDDLAVYMKGNITLADGKSRTFAYQWAFATTEKNRVDSFKFELSKSAASADSRTVAATVKRAPDSRTLLVDGECKTTVKTKEQTVTTTDTYDLSGKADRDARTITGSLTTAVCTTVGEKGTTMTTALAPDLKLTAYEGSAVLSGTVGVEVLHGKDQHTKLTLSFDETAAEQLKLAAQNGALFAVADEVEMPVSSLDQNVYVQEEPSKYLVGKPPIGYTAFTAPEEMQSVDLDAASPEQRDALLTELSQQLAGRLLIALSKLPQEDAALIRDNLSEEDFNAFLTMVDGL